MQNTTTKKSKNIMDMFSGKQILIPIAAASSARCI